MGLLGGTQAYIPTDEEVGARDAAPLAEEEQLRAEKSREWFEEFAAKFALAKSDEEVEEISRRIGARLKKEMLPADVSALRAKYVQAKQRVNRGLCYSDD